MSLEDALDEAFKRQEAITQALADKIVADKATKDFLDFLKKTMQDVGKEAVVKALPIVLQIAVQSLGIPLI